MLDQPDALLAAFPTESSEMMRDTRSSMSISWLSARSHPALDQLVPTRSGLIRLPCGLKAIYPVRAEGIRIDPIVFSAASHTAATQAAALPCLDDPARAVANPVRILGQPARIVSFGPERGLSSISNVLRMLAPAARNFVTTSAASCSARRSLKTGNPRVKWQASDDVRFDSTVTPPVTSSAQRSSHPDPEKR
jgi:hypothetical protein